MKLHNDKEAFAQAIIGASRYYGVNPALVEKDYFVTLVLEKINERVPGLLFKGGTSLSKCYKIIDRFSEDIDLTLDEDHFTQGQRRKIKYIIIDVCKESGFTLVNEKDTRSRREYNVYRIDYPIQHPSSAVKPVLLVETVFMQKAYPHETRSANSMIGEWLESMHNEEAMAKYELHPFQICVQTLERTLVDKVFAICDYMVRGAGVRQSRHIYDISRLLTKVDLNQELKQLIKEVREDRRTNKMCVSAQDGVSVPELLQKVIDSRYYEKDYDQNTLPLLSKPISYEEAVESLNAVISSGLFD